MMAERERASAIMRENVRRLLQEMRDAGLRPRGFAGTVMFDWEVGNALAVSVSLQDGIEVDEIAGGAVKALVETYAPPEVQAMILNEKRRVNRHVCREQHGRRRRH